MLVFLLAMALHPEAMKKAQEEIDFVVGNDRLPDYTADRDSLIYVTAVMKECMRWQLVAPIGTVIYIHLGFRLIPLQLFLILRRMTTNTMGISFPKAPLSLGTPGRLPTAHSWSED